jgi:arginine-tRNA-protein transferase
MSDQEPNDVEVNTTESQEETQSKPKQLTEQIKTGLGLSPEEWWMNHSARGDWARGRYFQRVELERSTPQMMDALWADGWRHFGTTFFRDYFNIHGKRLVRVLPLRIKLSDYRPRRDHRRLIKRNQELDVSFRPILLTPEHNDLFKRHAERFVENRPPSLYSFLSLSPVLVPCPSLMCEIREGEKLLAASFF